MGGHCETKKNVTAALGVWDEKEEKYSYEKQAYDNSDDDLMH